MTFRMALKFIRRNAPETEQTFRAICRNRYCRPGASPRDFPCPGRRLVMEGGRDAGEVPARWPRLPGGAGFDVRHETRDMSGDIETRDIETR